MMNPGHAAAGRQRAQVTGESSKIFCRSTEPLTRPAQLRRGGRELKLLWPFRKSFTASPNLTRPEHAAAVRQGAQVTGASSKIFHRFIESLTRPAAGLSSVSACGTLRNLTKRCNDKLRIWRRGFLDRPTTKYTAPPVQAWTCVDGAAA